MSILTIALIILGIILGLKFLRGLLSFLFNLAMIGGLIWAVWYFFF